MRLLHLADLHLGKRVNGFDLLDDQQFILEQVLALCEERRVQAVLLAGDLYDTPLPPAAAVTLLDRFLTELAARHIFVAAIAGNHDSAERLNYGHTLFAGSGIYLAGGFSGSVQTVSLADEYGPVEFCLLPFVRRATVAHYLPEPPLPDYTAAVAAALSTLPPRSEGRRVLLAHQFVTAGKVPPSLDSTAEAPYFVVGAVDNVDSSVFAPHSFDYVALGHIHRPQRVGCDSVRYAGSPLCYSLDECGAAKSATLVTLGPHGMEDCELLPLTPKRAMRHLRGPLAKLIDPSVVTDAEDYIWATLTDETRQPDAMPMLRAAYPNAMRLDFAERSATSGDAELSAQSAAALRSKSMNELLADFFLQMQGRPLTPAEQAELDLLQKEVQA